MEYGIGLPPRCTAELETVRADGSLRWVEICSEVSAKDRLHDNLVARCRGGEEGDWEEKDGDEEEEEEKRTAGRTTAGRRRKGRAEAAGAVDGGADKGA